MTAAQVIKGVETVSTGIQAGAAIVGGAYMVHQGVLEIEAAGFRNDADKSNIQQKNLQNLVDMIQQMIADRMDDLQELLDRIQAGFDLCSQVLQAEHGSVAELASLTGRQTV